MSDVTQILLNAQCGDDATMKAAEAQLESARVGNLPTYMMTMIKELHNEKVPGQARMLAGLMMKNAIYSKNDVKCKDLQQAWLAIDKATRDQVKAGCLQTLLSPDQGARSQSAQVIAKIALCELPVEGQWPDLIQLLNNNVVGQGAAATAMHGSLITLGYICQDMSEAGSEECLEAQANAILTAVMHGLKTGENDDIKFAAISALSNAIEFASSSFERDAERNYIMQTVCESTSCPDQRVRQEAIDCLVSVAYYYYDRLMPYLQAVMQITFKAIKEDQEDVATSAMEFWTTVADSESDLMYQIEEGEIEEKDNLKITEQATPHLLPVIQECLLRQTEDDDEDAWTVYQAAGVCLKMMVACVRDNMVDELMKFVNANINSPNWVNQDAATLAFGTLLDGPTPQKLQPYVGPATQHFLTVVGNPAANVKVRDSTAWALARILECHADLVPPECLNPLMEKLVGCLKDEPRVAVHACFAFVNFVAYVEDQLEEPTPATTHLSPYTQILLTKLVEAANRGDADEQSNGKMLFECCYEAICSIIGVSGQDMFPILLQMIPAILQRFQQTFTVDLSTLPAAQRTYAHSVQGQACSVLAALCDKLEGQVLPHANDLMQGFIMVFNAKCAEAHEEAIMAIGALARACPAEFVRFMPVLKDHLMKALDNFEEYQICGAAVGLVGELSRAMEQQLVPYCEDIMTRLLQLLMKPELQRDVKPPILSTFADIALAISGQNFVRFMGHTMQMLFNASQTQVEDDPDEWEYFETLVEHILEGYSGITHSLRDADKAAQAAGQQPTFAAQLQEHLPKIVYLLEERITPMKEGSGAYDSVLKAALSLLGDLAQTLPPNLKQPFTTFPWVQQLLQKAQQCQDVDNECVAFASSILKP